VGGGGEERGLHLGLAGIEFYGVVMHKVCDA